MIEAVPLILTAASSRNIGCLHYYFPESFGLNLELLGIHSFEEWQSIAHNNNRFIADISYQSQSFFPITLKARKTEKPLPD